MVVPSVSDILLEFAPRLQDSLIKFSEMAVETRSDVSVLESLPKRTPKGSVRHLPGSAADLGMFMKMELGANALARGLPWTAFLLAPVQRVARYPLLVEAIERNTREDEADMAPVQRARLALTGVVKACNGRMRSLEEHLFLVQLDQQLDWHRLTESITLSNEFRTLVRRGRVDVVTVMSRKIVKSKRVEFFLFSDIFLYAKPVKVADSGLGRFIVYRSIPRSLLDVKALDIGPTLPDLFQVVLLSEEEPLVLTVQAASAVDRTRWMEAFKPPKGADDVYEIWDCPTAMVVRSYTARSSDEISVRAGETARVLNRGQGGWYKVAVSRPLFDGGVATRGWVPLVCLEEVHNAEHAKSKQLRALHKEVLQKPP